MNKLNIKKSNKQYIIKKSNINKINQQYIVKKSNILFPKDKITIKSLFCLNDNNYLYIVFINKKRYFYILDNSDLIKIDIISQNYDLLLLKDNKYNLKSFIIKQINNKFFLKYNDLNYFIKESYDIYLINMFKHIYNIVF